MLSFAAACLGLAALEPATCLAGTGRVAPQNPALLRYLSRAGSPAARHLGLAPAPVSFAGVPRGHLAPIVARFPSEYAGRASSGDPVPGRQASGLPGAFDLRTAGRLSPIRDQGFYGTCWAFAALASLESATLPGQAHDYSENNLVQRSGFGLGYDGGGNSSMAAAYLLRWDGPVDEADDPYDPYGSAPNPASSQAPARAHVHEVLDLPSRASASDNADLKWAVMTYGAVYTTMFWTDSAYRESTGAYCSSRSGANHAVDVVGWDDAFPASRFCTPPAGPGAFLVRNSWGTGFGRSGYLWVSYHDTSFGHQSKVFAGAEPAAPAERVYQHDTLGWTSSYSPPGVSDLATAWFAARYTPAEDGALTAAGFYATAPDTVFEVRVAESAEAAGRAPVAAAGTLPLAGYHTVALDAPVAVKAGRPFVIAVRLTTPGYGFPVAIERPIPGYADATSAAGQSLVSADGATWKDLTSLVPRADVCLKGYGRSPADAGDPAPVREKPRVSVSGRAAAAGSSVRVAFHVRSPLAGRRADVRLTLRSRHGDVTRRRTLHDVPVNARRRWRLRAPARRGPYVVKAVATLDSGEVSSPASAILRVR